MAELNFCPYCEASQHKLMFCSEDLVFCKECSKFFMFKDVNLKCPKCNKEDIRKSDFPSPAGEVIFQCNKCKKSFSAAEFFKYNKIK